MRPMSFLFPEPVSVRSARFWVTLALLALQPGPWGITGINLRPSWRG